MSLQSILFQIKSAKSEQERDLEIRLPKGVSECRNISYGQFGKSSLLDIYFPDGTTHALPTIVSIHGGEYVYGNKEGYRRYGMDLARRGFAFVNFNYRLAPRWKFPAPLEDINTVLEWVLQNAEQYHLDPQRIILIGDSAGAQLACQYAAISTNPQYASLFSFKVPPVNIRVLGLNCGFYTLKEVPNQISPKIIHDYLGSRTKQDDPRLDVLDSITADYPPVFLATAHGDFLKDQVNSMYMFLLSRNVKCAGKCYGEADDDYVAHSFQLNIPMVDATACNDEECAFFTNCL